MTMLDFPSSTQHWSCIGMNKNRIRPMPAVHPAYTAIWNVEATPVNAVGCSLEFWVPQITNANVSNGLHFAKWKYSNTEWSLCVQFYFHSVSCMPFSAIEHLTDSYFIEMSYELFARGRRNIPHIYFKVSKKYRRMPLIYGKRNKMDSYMMILA